MSKGTNMIRTGIAATMGALLLASAAFAGPMGTALYGNADVDALVAKAQTEFDFATEDAIVLTETSELTWSKDGRLTERLHRIVRITSDYGIDNYADLRVPYDGARQELTLEGMRVFRDGRWIEHRPTANVATLPYAFGEAPDYSFMRENMLLHDGIELPCVMEIVYSIEDKTPFRKGFEGAYVLRHEAPMVESNFAIAVPAAMKDALKLNLQNGVDDATATEANGMATMTFAMGPLGAAPTPETSGSIDYLPSIEYSTFANWEAFGKTIKAPFEAALVLDETLKAEVARIAREAVTPADIAAKIAAFVDESVRFVDYDEFWFFTQPRNAARVYATAYGNAIDRAVLVAAMCKEAGLHVWPVLMSDTFGNVDNNIPTAARMPFIGTWISGESLEGYYDPSEGMVFNGFAPAVGRSIWLPGSEDTPQVRAPETTTDGAANVRLNLTLKCCHASGNGYFQTTGNMSVFSEIQGTETEASDLLGDVVDGIIGGEISSWNPVNFEWFNVGMAFQCKTSYAEANTLGETALVIGEPAYGITEQLPENVHLFEAKRGTPVNLIGTLQQNVELKLDMNGHELVRLPASTSVENEAGAFTLTVEQDGNIVTLVRSIKLNKHSYAPGEWPALRALLLEEESTRNNTILFQK